MLIFVELQPIGVGVSGISAIFGISALHSLTGLRLDLSAQTAKAPTRSWGLKSGHPGIKPTLQCKFGARMPLVIRAASGGGQVLYVPPKLSAFALELLGWVPLQIPAKMILCISATIATNTLFVLPNATIVLGGCSNH